jgi:hypothetical protein
MSKLEKRFIALRQKVHNLQNEEFRIQNWQSPCPDVEEVLNIDIRRIEQPVRLAVIELTRAGIELTASGFYDADPTFQRIEGIFTVDDPTRQRLATINVDVYPGSCFYQESATPPTVIEFSPLTPDITSITNQWNQIADILLAK